MKNFERIKASLIDKYEGKSILILGFGREGKSTYHLFKQLNCELKLYIMDQNDQGVYDYLEKELDATTRVIPAIDYLKGLDGFDTIFKTPGLPGYLLKHLAVEKITSQSELFMEYLGERCIGITGTKGKSTTSSVIAYVLEQGGLNVRLVGNIGFPALESLLEDDGETIYVYEMSSFQTEFLQVGPKIGVILNLFEEHLNNYEGYEAYQQSKLQLFKAKVSNPKDQILVYGCDNHVLLDKIKDLRKIYEDRTYKTIGHSLKNSLSDTGYFIEDDSIIYMDAEGNKELVATTDFSRKLLGEHNLLNSLVAFIVVDKFNNEGLLTMSRDKVVQLLGDFKGLPHRLEDVGIHGGIHFYNDSISTIPEATIKAVEAIDNLGSLIIGGFDRKIDYQPLATYLDKLEDVAIICLPTTGHKVQSLMTKASNVYIVNDMIEAILAAYKYTKEGKGCLLSPAASSYNMYKNFEERGDHFVECIKKGLLSE